MVGVVTSNGSSVPPRMTPSICSSSRSLAERDDALPRVVAEVTLQQFADVALVHPRPLFVIRSYDCNAMALAHVWIERRLHRKPGTEQAKAPQAAPLPFVGANFDDAHQRNRRAAGELVEDDVRRVGGHDDEVDRRRRRAAESMQGGSR